MPGRAMRPARPRPRAGLRPPRPRASRRGLASARLLPYWRWRCWAGISACLLGSIASLWPRLARLRPRPRPRLRPRPRRRPRLLPGPAEDTDGAAAPAASAAPSPVRALPLGSAAPAPEPPVSPSKEATSGDTRPGAVEEQPGAVSGPGPSADSRVSPAGKAQQGLTERYRVGSLLGRGGFGSVFAATRLSDGAPVAIKRVPRNRIRHWGELPDGTSAPLEVVLLDKVSTGFPGVVQLLEWLELPNNVVLVMERPEHSEDLLHFIRARGFLSEEVARELFRQVLEAVRHCTSCGVLHRDLKPENILVDLATGQAKLIDFGCGTHLQDTAYTRFAGTPSYSPPEWNHFGWYYGEAATVWSLGIVLHQMVCGQHPFPKGRNISWGQLSLPQRLSQDCKELIRWCLSLHSLDRPSLEDLSCDPWLQDIHHP
ncbi:serine/threonine-protein kinase pim-1-like isoform X1 [Corvus moneduloides]|uniref:serine/threonine-protein kinase pim-1-like isoform X1 n=1 Tax=Corvus moneduloides TaxID=1196302 RepID=UPI001362A497|nr:serine/threonine-protein kinase pim-1-like isoform X1 [Corvus moneduloides]XP_031950626.1 serine/threonine-protein kinase pim-1-like isoform X1 [Corvus moneduloides]XP_031950627.1 serine/threonine-protein kinase pim-1-like isoform X1 [Corvus moneduloides]